MKPETITQMAVDYARSVGQITRYVIDAYTKGFNVGYNMNIEQHELDKIVQKGLDEYKRYIDLRKQDDINMSYRIGFRDGERKTLENITENPRNIVRGYIKDHYKSINILGIKILIEKKS